MPRIPGTLPAGLFRALPRDALAVAAELPPDGARCVSLELLVFGTLPDQLAAMFNARRVAVSRASTAEEFVRELASHDYHAVLVSQDVHDGIGTVRAVKLADASTLASEELRAAAIRQRRTPFFILPLPGEQDYALILAPPNLAYLAREGDVPFVDAVLRVNVDVLFKMAPS